jgi:sigma-E factor negative regulatory protein RseC
MIEERAVVVALHADTMLVEVQQQSGCGACQTKSACGTQLFGALFASRRRRLGFPNTVNAQVGDVVLLLIDERRILGSSVKLYMLPLLGLIVGAVVFDALARWWTLPADPMQILGAIAGMAGVFVWLRLASRHARAEHIVVRPLRPHVDKTDGIAVRLI